MNISTLYDVPLAFCSVLSLDKPLLLQQTSHLHAEAISHKSIYFLLVL